MFSFAMTARMRASALSVTTMSRSAPVITLGICSVVAIGSYYLRLRFNRSCNGRRRGILLLPVADGGADRVLCQHRAVDLHRRQSQLFHNVGVLDGERFVHRLALPPLGGE